VIGCVDAVPLDAGGAAGEADDAAGTVAARIAGAAGGVALGGAGACVSVDVGSDAVRAALGRAALSRWQPDTAEIQVKASAERRVG
jgi:hypothetical protein